MPRSIYDSEGIIESFKNIRKPFWMPGTSKFEGAIDAVNAPIPHVNVNAAKRALRAMLFSTKVKHAAYEWAYPHHAAQRGLKRLSHILRVVGLDHEDRAHVADQMANQIHSWISQVPVLSRWLMSRIALLRFCSRAKVPRELPDNLFLLRNQYTRVLNRAWYTPQNAVETADELFEMAIDGAAKAVSLELRHGNAELDVVASLMVPIRFDNLDSTLASLSKTAGTVNERSSRAGGLWKELDLRDQHTLFIVAGQTGGSDYLGFWVPFVQSGTGQHLPGAPEARANLLGSVVFTRDLPNLAHRGFSEALAHRWGQYVRDHVSGAHFVSIPFRVPCSESMTAFTVPAVLNVNASPPHEQDWWFRALHDEWLERAQKAAAPFVEVALNALHIRYALLGAPLALHTGYDGWNRLPGLPDQSKRIDGARRLLDQDMDAKKKKDDDRDGGEEEES